LLDYVEQYKLMYACMYVCMYLFRHFCFTMYCLDTIHSVTDRQTDGQTDNTIMPTADHARLKE